MVNCQKKRKWLKKFSENMYMRIDKRLMYAIPMVQNTKGSIGLFCKLH